MATMNEQEIARRALGIYRADKNGGITQELAAMRFGEKPGSRAVEALNKAGITQDQYISFLNNWQRFEESQGRQFSPVVQRAGGLLVREQSPLDYAQSVGVRVTGAGTPAPDIGRRGSQGSAMSESALFQGPPQPTDRGPYMPPNAGPQPQSDLYKNYFAPNAPAGQPEMSSMTREEYDRYVQGMVGVNETRQALGMQPVQPQSFQDVNRGAPTIMENYRGQGGQTRVLPMPEPRTNAPEMGYFGDRMAGPPAPINRGPMMPPNMGPQIPPMGPNDGPQLPRVGAEAVAQTPSAQVGQSAAQAPAYAAARDAMMSQAPAPAAQNAPPMRVTSPMVGPRSMEGAGMGAGVGAVGGGIPSGSGGIGGITGERGRGGDSRSQNIFAVQSQAPQQYATETEARRAAMAEAMRTGQPMVLTGSNLFVGNQASQAAPNAQASANAPTFVGGQLQAGSMAGAQQMMFNPLTRQYEPSSRGMEQGLSYRAGYNVAAGNPEENYQRQLTAMQRMSGMPEARTPAEAARAMSTAGRAGARADRAAERAATVQEARAGGRQSRGGRQTETSEPQLKPIELTPEQKRTQSGYIRSFSDIGASQIAALQGTLNPENLAYGQLTDQQKTDTQNVINIFKSQDYKDFVADLSSLLSTDDAERQKFTDSISKADTPQKKAELTLELFRQWKASNTPQGF